MEDYYKYDLGAIKVDLQRILHRNKEEQVEGPRDTRVRDIGIVFSRAIAAAKEHRAKGSNYMTDEASDEAKIMSEFEKYSEVYETLVKEANS